MRKSKQRWRGLAACVLSSAVLAGCVSAENASPEARDVGLIAERLTASAYQGRPGQRVTVAGRTSPAGVYYITQRDGGVLQVDTLNAYVRGMATRLAATVERADYTGPFGVSVISRPTLGAFTTPKNDMVIPVGLLERTSNEAETAFVIAHELAHIVRDDLERTKVMAEQDRAARILRRVTRISDEIVSRYQNVAVGDSDDAEEIQDLRRKIEIAVHGLQITLQAGVGPAWNLAQEKSADLVAADFLYYAGYNPYNAVGIFSKLGNAEAERNAAIDRHVKEILTLSAELADINADDPMLSDLKAGGLEKGTDFVSGIIDLFTTTPYEAAEEREEAFKDHVLEYYGISEGSRVRPSPLEEAMKADPEYQEAMKRLTLAREADARFNEAYALSTADDPDAADERDAGIEESVDIARDAIAGRGSAMAVPRLVFHRIRDMTGNKRFARLNLDYVVDKPELGPAPAFKMAKFLANDGNPDDALDMVRWVERQYGRAGTYALAYDVNAALGNTNEAAEILRTCLDQSSDLYMRSQCQLREVEEESFLGGLDGLLD